MNTFMRSAGLFFVKNATKILTGASVGFTVLAVVEAHQASRKSADIYIREARRRMEGVVSDEHKDQFWIPASQIASEFTIKERVQMSWKCYITTGIFATAAVSCAIGAHVQGVKQYAALAGAYAASEKSFIEYRKKVKEVIGEDKEKSVRDEVAKEHADRTPPEGPPQEGKVWTHDMQTGHNFWCDIQRAQQAENNINKALASGDIFVDMNEFLHATGQPECSLGENNGWIGINSDKWFDLRLTSMLDERNNPMVVFDYDVYSLADFKYL